MNPNYVTGLLRSTLQPISRKIFGPLRDQFAIHFRNEIEEHCQSLLDVGCGFNSPVQLLRKRPAHLVGVDAYAPVLEESRSRKLHDEYRLMNVLSIKEAFGPKSFDCVIACDLIEHLERQDGLELIAQMEHLARKSVIIYTPNGFLPQGEEYGNPLQRHLSGWNAREMQHRGYTVIGIQGLKSLRGEMATVRWKPTFFWERLSLLSQLLTEKRPSLAFRLFCVKRF